MQPFKNNFIKAHKLFKKSRLDKNNYVQSTVAQCMHTKSNHRGFLGFGDVISKLT